MFRLIRQEIVFRGKGILGWGLGLCFFPIVYLGIYPSVAEEMAGLADLELYRAMGIDLANFEGWIGSIIILFVPLLVGVYAIINGTGTLAGEEEDGRLEMIVALPLPRWQILIAKAVALSIATAAIMTVVAIASYFVFLSIESQVDTTIDGMDVALSLMQAWPLVFAIGMLALFLASFAATRRAASMIATVIMVAGYFGANLADSASALEPVEPFFLFTYLDYTANAVLEGQSSEDVVVLLAIGVVALLLAVLFFNRRNLTTGAWPWNRPRM